jgi:hypothetical protein
MIINIGDDKYNHIDSKIRVIMQRVAMVSSIDHYLIANMAYPNK